MLKPFILFLIFESGAGLTALHHIEFSSRQACDAAKLTMLAKAKQARPAASDAAKPEGKPAEVLKIIDASCLEK